MVFPVGNIVQNLNALFPCRHSNVIDRNTQQSDDHARPGVLRLKGDQQAAEGNSHDNIDGWQERVSKCFVGPLCFGPLSPKDEYADDGKYIEDHHYKRHHIQQVTISAA